MLRALRRLLKYSLVCAILYLLLSYTFNTPPSKKLSAALLNLNRRSNAAEENETQTQLTDVISRINSAMKANREIDQELVEISQMIVNGVDGQKVDWSVFTEEQVKEISALINQAKGAIATGNTPDLASEVMAAGNHEPEVVEKLKANTSTLKQKPNSSPDNSDYDKNRVEEQHHIYDRSQQKDSAQNQPNPDYATQKLAYSSLYPESLVLHDESSPDKNQFSSIVPTIVFACNRETVARALDKLLVARSHLLHNQHLPIIVSQDTCDHQKTSDIIQKYADENEYVYFLRQTDRSDPAPELPTKSRRNQLGYYKLARHYKSGINSIFYNFNEVTGNDYKNSKTDFSTPNHVIILEDDLDVSEDFYTFMLAASQVLDVNDNLYCVSAWNDNGKPEFIDTSEFANYKIHYSDFFPGLGWILKKSIWEEWAPKWPKAYWDDWVRGAEQRKNRSCLRPEVSRTQTFGKKGVSNGQFFDKHLKYMKLADTSNDKFISLQTWSNLLQPLRSKDQYNEIIISQVENAHKIQVTQLKSICGGGKNKVRVEYDSEAGFKSAAKIIGIMSDSKSGVPRTAYLGIVQAKYLNCERVFITPSIEALESKYVNLRGYDTKWKGNP